MPQTADTTIIIGGRLKRRDEDRFWKAVEYECVFDLMGAYQETVDRDNFDPVPGDTLSFNDPDRSWGHFEFLESELVKLGLPFERYNDDGWRRVFTGTGEPQDVPADADGTAVVDAKKAAELGSFEAIMAYLAAADFSPPPFEIVDDDAPPLASVMAKKVADKRLIDQAREETRLARVEQHSTAQNFEAELAASDPIRPGEYEKAIMAGYTVQKSDDDDAYWAVGPEHEDLTPHDPYPTERAAWEACDSHRMFGTLDGSPR